jgi:hypothetical protein
MTNVRKIISALALSVALVAPLKTYGLAVNLGSAAQYTVVGVGGSVSVQSDFEIYQHDTLIVGNVAQGPYTDLTHGIDATVIGRWDYDTTDADPSASGYTGNVTGGFHQLNLAGVAADSRAASAAAAALAFTQTFATLAENQVVVGGAGLNVIRITGDVSLKIGLTIQGPAGSEFVFQFTSPTTDGHDVLELSGMNMTLSGGVTRNNILWNLNGLGGGITIKAMADDQSVFGTFLAPDRDILADHGIVFGRLIGGGSGNTVSIHSGSQIVPDAGSTLALMGIGLAMLAAAKRKFLS